MRDLGDQVVVEVHIKAVGRASGVALDQIAWYVLGLRDGKVATGHAYTNKLGVPEATGLSE